MQIKRLDGTVIGEWESVAAAVAAQASLRGASLRGAYLSGADLSGASLSGASLSGADLRGADLSGASLRGADLREADLRWADLREADLRGAYLGHRSIVPEVGAFTAWKKLQDGTLCRVLIPAEAQRTSSYVGRKCRASEVLVLEGEGYSSCDHRTHYEPGLTVLPDSYDPDPRVECSHGIHFFLTRAEAEEY